MNNYLPVTILTGFLGSGKTTLINNLLNHNQHEKIMIIENEFGPINIDSKLLKSDRNIEILEMTNGCICCSVQTFFIDEFIRETIQLDAVVTLVDCEHIINDLNEHRVIASQIGFADRIILTKTDRISDDEKVIIVKRISNINRKATILEAKHGQIAKSQWLDINAFQLNDDLHLNNGLFIFENEGC